MLRRTGETKGRADTGFWGLTIQVATADVEIAMLGFLERNELKGILMAIREPKDLSASVDVIFGLIKVHRSTANPDTRAWANSVLDHACRQLECFVVPEVSVRAAEEAAAQGLPDIRGFTWSDQVNRMRDVGREVFHWEHVLPVAEMKRRLLDPKECCTAQDVEKIIASVDIAWILKTEDAMLTANGFLHRRPDDPWDAYAKSGIEILAAKYAARD